MLLKIRNDMYVAKFKWSHLIGSHTLLSAQPQIHPLPDSYKDWYFIAQRPYYTI